MSGQMIMGDQLEGGAKQRRLFFYAVPDYHSARASRLR